MASGRQFLAAAERLLGFRYSTGPTRLTGADGYTDCSGLVVIAAHTVGLSGVATSSSSQARACQAAGRLLSVAAAAHTPGALLFNGPNHAYSGYGPLGHVAISVGDGAHTCEARGHAYGVVIGPIAGRSWSNAGILPGITADTPAPSPTPGGHVVPQFQPPAPVVSICHFTHPTLGECAAALTADGGVLCDPDTAYLGGVNPGTPAAAAFAGRTPARIERPTPEEAAAGKHYVIVATSTERYHFPTG